MDKSIIVLKTIFLLALPALYNQRREFMILKYIIIFLLGFLLTFIVSVDFFDQYNLALSLFSRIIFALFFLLIIWLLQKIFYKRSTK